MLKVAVLGAANRRLQPGCQMDSVGVLKGKQGSRKTTFWKVLASPDWFCSTMPQGEKDQLLNVHSCWIFELAELEHITGRTAAGALKNLITTTSDNFRLPYQRRANSHDRNSIFVSSVNGDDFLRDNTGSRRFLVIECPQNPDKGETIDTEAVRRDRDAIWKTAVLSLDYGEQPFLSADDQAENNSRNTQYHQDHPWQDAIEEWLGQRGDEPFTSKTALVNSGCRNETCIARKDEMEISQILQSMGYAKNNNKEIIRGVRGRYWHKVEID